MNRYEEWLIERMRVCREFEAKLDDITVCMGANVDDGERLLARQELRDAIHKLVRADAAYIANRGGWK